jgi:endonuclease/exonuclease/phosphatase family metal-dependent hydrolase
MLRKWNFVFFSTCLLSLFSAHSLLASQTPVSVMTYNLENLFDTTHDEGKNDWDYLPLDVKKADAFILSYCQSHKVPERRKTCLEMDWNSSTLRKKILNLASVVKTFNSGNGPDILVVQEVENLSVLKKFNEWGQLGFKEVILLEGPDSRGIDVGILSKYPLDGRPIGHEIDFTDLKAQGYKVKDTRLILEATFNVEGKKLTIFANHWPSQANIDQARLEAAKTLWNVAKLRSDSAIIALGDFNTAESDNPHGINTFIANKNKSHSFLDTQVESKKNLPGTHWYQGTWDHLDRIFLARNSVDSKVAAGNCQNDFCVTPDWSSFKVIKPSFVLTDAYWKNPATGKAELAIGVPKRFDYKTGEGYSDHLAAVLEVNLW